MAYRYIRPAQRDNLNMLKIEMDGKEEWVECSSPVKEFAKQHINEGDMVEFEYELKAGKKHIKGLINKEGEPAPKGDYSKPASTTKASSYSGKSFDPSVNESIKRQAIGHMTSRTLIALQGRVDPNNIYEIMAEIYKKYQELVG